MVITNQVRAELLASGWAEPVTDPVRLEALAHIARNQQADMIVALPHGQAYVLVLEDRKPIIEWWGLDEPDRLNPALSSDLTDWAAEQDGPVRCWTV